MRTLAFLLVALLSVSVNGLVKDIGSDSAILSKEHPSPAEPHHNSPAHPAHPSPAQPSHPSPAHPHVPSPPPTPAYLLDLLVHDENGNQVVLVPEFKAEVTRYEANVTTPKFTVTPVLGSASECKHFVIEVEGSRVANRSASHDLVIKDEHHRKEDESEEILGTREVEVEVYGKEFDSRVYYLHVSRVNGPPQPQPRHWSTYLIIALIAAAVLLGAALFLMALIPDVSRPTWLRRLLGARDDYAPLAGRA